jgi:ketosteroid isomerase-like protein
MTTPSMDDVLAVASRLFAAIEAGDIEIVRGLYDPDVEIWHNTDRAVQGRDDNLKVLAWLTRHLRDVRYTEVQRSAFEGGFVQRHVLVATNRAGRRVEVPACIVAAVHGGRIARLDEYLDSAAVAAISEGPA